MEDVTTSDSVPDTSAMAAANTVSGSGKWIRKAAAQGEPRSQALLGASYANGGKGSPQDDIEAEKLFRKSAEQGWAEGQHNLACCYMDGRGIKQDDKLALEWFRKAAVQGYPDSQYHVAHFFLTGRAVDKDEVEAVKWLAKAAEKGHANAQFYLGSAYAIGTGVKQDFVQAHKWVSLALERGKGDKEALPALREKMTLEQIKEAERLANDFKANAVPSN